jgi:hypothetical protein
VSRRRIVTVEQLAEYLGIPQKDLSAVMNRDGNLRLPTFTEGGKTYADLEEVENWLLALLDGPALRQRSTLKSRWKRQ